MSKTALTYRDYAALPDDGRRYEIHDGELSVTPAPTTEHQIVSRRLFLVLHRWLETHPGGELFYAPLDVILADTAIVQPDLVYVGPDRRARISERGIEGAPTLAVEILSPSTRSVDRVTKPGLYARHGVPFFWLVDPAERTVEAFFLEAGSYPLAVRAAGPGPIDLPPFPGVGLVPDTLW
ncbi:MAG TPA: Uma2 family endonuclease [Candidatus Tectomicrobia bacterium]|nr:Uma2 family endonuclease [Candidatus Tectomicrobia bacterium]